MFVSKLIAAVSAAVMFVAPVIQPEEPLPEIQAESAVVAELGTMTVLSEKKADVPRPIGHNAKLMTVLIAAEMLSEGKLSLNDEATASPNANAEQGTQIWLEVGDKITVDELLKSIIIGNANDACVCLAEYISGSVEDHVSLLNKTAKRLGMNDTHFADCTGMSKETVSTAFDITILARELVKYDNMTEYFNTWMCDLLCKDVNLVSNNRLIRSCKGMLCQKISASEVSGECAIITVYREKLTICIVMFGCDNRDDELYVSKDILDNVFYKYQIYKPEIDKEIPKKITVINGQKPKIHIKQLSFTGIILPTGTAGKPEYKIDLPESVEAPVKSGQKLGTVTYFSGDTTLMTVDIIAAEDDKQADFAFSVRRSLLNLLSF